jgi:hypothetical protein
VASRLISDQARTSLLSIRQHPAIVASVNVNPIEANECISENDETSYDLIEQYTGVKNRLDLIETTLKKLNAKLDANTKMIERAMLSSANNRNDTSRALHLNSQYGFVVVLAIGCFTGLLLSFFLRIFR